MYYTATWSLWAIATIAESTLDGERQHRASGPDRPCGPLQEHAMTGGSLHKVLDPVVLWHPLAFRASPTQKLLFRDPNPERFVLLGPGRLGQGSRNSSTHPETSTHKLEGLRPGGCWRMPREPCPT